MFRVWGLAELKRLCTSRHIEFFFEKRNRIHGQCRIKTQEDDQTGWKCISEFCCPISSLRGGLTFWFWSWGHCVWVGCLMSSDPGLRANCGVA